LANTGDSLICCPEQSQGSQSAKFFLLSSSKHGRMERSLIFLVTFLSLQSFSQSFSSQVGQKGEVLQPNLVESRRSQNFSSQIAQRAEALQPKLEEWRRYLHEHPELSNREYKTAEFVATHMRALGIEVQTGIAKTGVVGILRGAKPGPVIALRADMDALPIKERVDVPFQSTVTAEYLGNTVPVMHACGHDSHVAMLLGTADVLSAMKNELAGTVKFIFQPAEEGPPGAADGERRSDG
jgi:amidohydrolase